MIETLLKYFSVAALSTFKFVAGPLAGLGYGFSIVATSLLTFSGMMTSVVLFSNFNRQIQEVNNRVFKRKKKRKVFTPRNRRFVKLWVNYGLEGVAFLTPLLLTPIIGTILANTFSREKHKIIRYMAVSGLFWSFTITVLLHYFGAYLRSVLPI